MLVLDEVAAVRRGVAVLSDVNLQVWEGEVVALVGERGAGKTAVLDVVVGDLRPGRGSVRFRRREIGGLASHRVARLGLVRSHQEPRLFEGLTVLENMLVGVRDRRTAGLLPALLKPRSTRWREEAVAAEAMLLLEHFGLQHQAAEPARALSAPQRKLVSLSRAMLSYPPLLLLDDPLAGLSPEAAERVVALLAGLRGEGMAQLLAARPASLPPEMVDRVVVLRPGGVTAEGSSAGRESR